MSLIEEVKRINESATHAVEKKHNNKLSIFVDGLKYDISEEDVRGFFIRCGKIKYVKINKIKKIKNKKPKANAFIEFETENGFKKALECDGFRFKGELIKVMPKRENTPGKKKFLQKTTNS